MKTTFKYRAITLVNGLLYVVVALLYIVILFPLSLLFPLWALVWLLTGWSYYDFLDYFIFHGWDKIYIDIDEED